jgi:hypothetical protein
MSAIGQYQTPRTGRIYTCIPVRLSGKTKEQALDSLNLGLRASILVLAGLVHVDKL